MNEINVLLTNLKNYPWHLYPDFKINEKTAKALIKKIEESTSDPKIVEDDGK